MLCISVLLCCVSVPLWYMLWSHQTPPGPPSDACPMVAVCLLICAPHSAAPAVALHSPQCCNPPGSSAALEH